MNRLAFGLDFGTSSVRGLLVSVETGEEVASSVYAYPSGIDGVLYDDRNPNVARQNPSDYLSGIETISRELLSSPDVKPEMIIGIGVDTTGSSPIPVDANGNSISQHPDLAKNLDAYVWLWKDHTGADEAEEITRLCERLNRPFLSKCGGSYSSEWFWSKILRCARSSPDVFEAATSWVELADWIPGQLTGNGCPASVARGICAAGHKAMFNNDWGGLPDEAFLNELDPRLGSLRKRLYSRALTSNFQAGTLCESIAKKCELPEGIPVAVGAFDAHMGAVGAGIRPGILVKIMGTSTCDCMVHSLSSELDDIPGLCGIVKGSILPDCYGLEAGQSAVGDLFQWTTVLTGKDHAFLTAQAALSKPGASGLLALDWNNGNRTVLVDQKLSGLIMGQTLRTTPGELYRSMIEATAYGARIIVDRFEEYGVRVESVVACGGIADRSDLAMQIYADVLNRQIKVDASTQTCALGAAIFGAVASGTYASVSEAQSAMCGGPSNTYKPSPAAAVVYERLYILYKQLHDAFGVERDIKRMSNVMKELIEIRDTELSR